MPKHRPKQPSISELIPSPTKVLLTGGGKQFVERIGVEAVKSAIHSVMLGENLRTQTEPISRRRIAQISGALIALFTKGYLQIPDFQSKLSSLAVDELKKARRSDNSIVWPAQWLIGLTGKSVQNVLRSNPHAFGRYVYDFEKAVQDAAKQCREQLGDYRVALGYIEGANGERVELDWEGIIRLTTAIGAQTLTIRGSDKSIYGKLFERLILGSYLSILDFQRVDPRTNKKTKGVFWLSDSSDIRESDATLLVSPGKLARFDIGFIGPGNSEISKDKLSRFAREIEVGGSHGSSVTFIIVDRLPKTGKTEKAATTIGAEIVQMSMQYWPRDLAIRLANRLGIKHELAGMPDDKIADYLAAKLRSVQVQDFVAGYEIPSDTNNDNDNGE
jgi:hypothetical protein